MEMVRVFSTLLLFTMFIHGAGAESLKGDVNGDGVITSVDALIALQMSVGKVEAAPVADVDGNGYVTAYDALQILQYAVGDKDPLFVQIYSIIHDLRIGDLMKDERMNWYIKRSDGSELKVGVIISGGVVTDVRKGEIPDPSMNVFSDEDTVKNLLKSQNPDDLRKYIDEGKIKVEGVGIGNQVRVALFNFLSKIIS